MQTFLDKEKSKILLFSRHPVEKDIEQLNHIFGENKVDIINFSPVTTDPYEVIQIYNELIEELSKNDINVDAVCFGSDISKETLRYFIKNKVKFIKL